MNRVVIYGMLFLAIILMFTACTLKTNNQLLQEYLSGTQTAEAANLAADEPAPTEPVAETAETLSSTLAPVSRCDLFSDSDLDVYLLNVYPSSLTMTIYTQFPEAVIGLEDGTEDGFPWEYNAQLGDVQSIWCSLFEGEEFAGRLYCLLPLPKEYRNASRPFSLTVNLCDEPIVSIPSLSIHIEKSPVAGSSGGSSGESSSGHSITNPLVHEFVKICGTATYQEWPCTSEYESWCNCMGGLYMCDWAGFKQWCTIP